MQPSRPGLSTIIDRALRWHVCISLCVYGAGKWVQFGYGAVIDAPVRDMSDMEVMWAFYGRSKGYALIIGALELFAGGMLLFRRTKLVGALLATSILVNVVLQDIFYDVIGGALLAAVLYQLEVLAIFWLDRKRLLAGFAALSASWVVQPRMRWWWTALWTFLGLLLLLFLEKWLIPVLLF